jgi:hypothetical protein
MNPYIDLYEFNIHILNCKLLESLGDYRRNNEPMFQGLKRRKCHISIQNLNILNLWVTSLIYQTLFLFIVNVKLNHSHLKSNNLSLKCEFQHFIVDPISWSTFVIPPLSWYHDSDVTCWGVRGHEKNNGSILHKNKKWTLLLYLKTLRP